MRHIVAFTALAFAAYLFDQGWKFWPWLLMVVVALEYLLVGVRRFAARWWNSDSLSSKLAIGIGGAAISAMVIVAIFLVVADYKKQRVAKLDAEARADFWRGAAESDAWQKRFQDLLASERAGTITPSDQAMLDAARNQGAIREPN